MFYPLERFKTIFNMKKREKFDERLQLKLIQAEEKNEGEKK